MSQLSEQQVLDALRAVQWNGEDIVARGMIGGITFAAEGQGTKVSVILQITPQKDTDYGSLQKQVEQTVASIKGVSLVSVILTAHQAPQAQRQPRRRHL